MWFKKSFKERALKWVSKQIGACLPDTREATAAWSAFLAILRVDVEKHGMDIDARANRLEREFRNPDVLGMMLLDHVVSQMKTANETHPDGQWSPLIELLEHILDCNPGVIVPVNGRIGRVMATPEMARFLKQA